MKALPGPVQSLISALSQWPGIGPRSAERLALHIVQADLSRVQDLARVLVDVREQIRTCPTCGALTESNPCALCADDQRDASLVCIVERPVDIISIEKSGAFPGKYHVLGGKISPLDGVGPEDLRIGELEARLEMEPIRELVLALGLDVEGDATSHYLARHFSAKGIKVTRIAQGLPAGSGLEFADELTLSRALEGRREVD